jgi:hypothetical protein
MGRGTVLVRSHCAGHLLHRLAGRDAWELGEPVVRELAASLA